MSMFAKRWRDRATLIIGGYLISTPWIFGASGDEPISTNAWVVGICLVLVALRALLEAGPRAGELTRIGIGFWLLASPFALGFAGSVMAWNAWAVGALTIAFAIALADVPRIAFTPVILAASLRRARLRSRVRRLSPQKIVGYERPEEPPSPGLLCWHIVECSDQIHGALRRNPSEAQVEACTMGHAACMRDLATLIGLIAEYLPKSGPVQRRKLGLVRWAATRSTHRAGEALLKALGIAQRSGSS